MNRILMTEFKITLVLIIVVEIKLLATEIRLILNEVGEIKFAATEITLQIITASAC